MEGTEQTVVVCDQCIEAMLRTVMAMIDYGPLLDNEVIPALTNTCLCERSRTQEADCPGKKFLNRMCHIDLPKVSQRHVRSWECLTFRFEHVKPQGVFDREKQTPRFAPFQRTLDVRWSPCALIQSILFNRRINNCIVFLLSR